jgi:hypothetical protein
MHTRHAAHDSCLRTRLIYQSHNLFTLIGGATQGTMATDKVTDLMMGLCQPDKLKAANSRHPKAPPLTEFAGECRQIR